MYFFHASKEMLIKTMMFLVFGSPVSLRHAVEPLAICPAKTKKTIVVISIAAESIIKHQEHHSLYEHFLCTRNEKQ